MFVFPKHSVLFRHFKTGFAIPVYPLIFKGKCHPFTPLRKKLD
jgi:hypothetical protein